MHPHGRRHKKTLKTRKKNKQTNEKHRQTYEKKKTNSQETKQIRVTIKYTKRKKPNKHTNIETNILTKKKRKLRERRTHLSLRRWFPLSSFIHIKINAIGFE